MNGNFPITQLNILKGKYPGFIILILSVVSFLWATNSHAQFRDNQFGKNRVQYKKMDWRYISTPNFDVYFYDGGYDVAKLAAKYAEDDFDRITDMVGFSPYNKTKILIYNSIIDLQQSNIGVYHQGFDEGGQTNFVRSEIELAFTGNKAQFKEELALGISDILIFEMMYGGSLKEIFQSSYLLNLPEWFMAGAARYIAHGWDVEMDDYMRDIMARGKVKKITNIEGEDAKLVGQAVWNYIAEEYGKSNIANVLNLTRIVRNEEQSIQQTLGISFKSFLKGWKAYYEKQYDAIAETHTVPKEEQLFKKNKKNYIYNQVKISPNGKYLAYTQNNKGKYKVKIFDLVKEKEKTVLKGGYKLINQRVDEEMPLIAWRDKAELGIFGERNGKIYLWFYEINKRGNKRREKRHFRSFSNIKNFDIASNGNNIAMVAEWRGKNNLYYYDYRQRKLTQLTNDPFDYLTPKFLPGRDNSIVFSSNRPNDIIEVIKEQPEADEVSDNFNVFIYNFKTPNQLQRVSNTLSKDLNPTPINSSSILYLSDQRGISHLYKYDLKDSISTQLTNFTTSIKEYDFKKKDLFTIMLKNGDEHIVRVNDFNTSKTTFTGKTYRQQVLDLRNLQAMKKKRQQEERAKQLAEEKERKRKEQEARLEEIRKSAQVIADSVNSVVDSLFSGQAVPDSLIEKNNMEPETIGDSTNISTPVEEVAQDSTKKEELNTDDYQFDTFTKKKENETVADTTKKSIIDTDNYQFDTFSQGKRKSFLDKYRSKLAVKQEENTQLKISKSRPYEKMFAADNFLTSIRIDPQRGWGLLFEVAMTDVLENHKINAGIFFVTNLNNSNLFAEYEFLKTRLDYRARFERRNLEIPSETFTQKYHLNMFEGSVSYPFNITTRVSFEPFFATTRYTNTDILNLSVPDEVINYTGFNAEFIYDNSVITGVNMIQGTRMKARYEKYFGLGKTGINKGFGQFVVDFRNYQKIHKSIIFATRLSFGQFMGKAKKNYLLGGMDNWLFNKYDEETQRASNNPLNTNPGANNSDLLFVEFVTSMRGFQYNKLFGNNFMLFNGELRLPLIKYFYKGTISSKFFRNLQFVGFTDIGSAWTGVSPFNRENALNTEIIDGRDPEGFSFVARVKNFKNPFLLGYGVGVRSTLLGYYTKFDVAWGLEDNRQLDPLFYLTLGHDF
ncbi:hypothetical protein [Flexithrix dorotheae]|uniref:hypothetical protein n=1 Tax=Flexithrix dorotheae TaxID=70993 RepID=UPI00037679BE|nr:hypothetical protein [Flexithrix dorotheae]